MLPVLYRMHRLHPAAAMGTIFREGPVVLQEKKKNKTLQENMEIGVIPVRYCVLLTSKKHQLMETSVWGLYR